jgi:hypothetical protein
MRPSGDVAVARLATCLAAAGGDWAAPDWHAVQKANATKTDKASLIWRMFFLPVFVYLALI